MRSPLTNLLCVGANSVVKRAAHHFPTRCHQLQLTPNTGDSLPVTQAARGKTRSLWCAVAAGAFLFRSAAQLCSAVLCPARAHASAGLFLG